MNLPWRRRMLPFVAGVVALAGLGAVSSTAANPSPPNFDIFATGPVGFGCAYGGTFFPFTCVGFAIQITGDAPAYGTQIGDDARFQPVEIASPRDATSNNIDGHATVTASNGDQLFIHYCGISPAVFPDANGVGHLDDHLVFDITGGTGHFSNASGNGNLTAGGDVFFDARPTIVSSELKGTITMQTHGATPTLLCGTT
jgi:hypothetical protein